MTDQERIEALENLVAGMQIETNKVREHLGDIFVSAPSGAYAITPDTSTIALVDALKKVTLAGRTGVDLAVNAERRGPFWFQEDAAKASYLLRLSTTGTFQVLTVPAAAGQIDWATATDVIATTGAAGLMSAADKTLLANATASRTATTLALRDAAGNLLCSAWTGVSYSANWSDKAGYQAVQYRLGIDKTVHIRGVATKSIALVAGETIFTLPTGFRPVAQLSRPISSANGATPSLALCVILTNGTVTVYGGDKDHVSVDGLTFYLD